MTSASSGVVLKSRIMTLDDILNVAGPLTKGSPFAGLGPSEFEKEHDFEEALFKELKTRPLSEVPSRVFAATPTTVSTIADAAITSDKIDWSNLVGEWIVAQADREIASMPGAASSQRSDPLFGSW